MTQMNLLSQSPNELTDAAVRCYLSLVEDLYIKHLVFRAIRSGIFPYFCLLRHKDQFVDSVFHLEMSFTEKPHCFNAAQRKNIKMRKPKMSVMR